MGTLQYGPFEWDSGKDAVNRLKHGIGFMDACAAFEDIHRVLAYDSKHSLLERRWYCIGRVGQEIATVRYTLRNGHIRILGAGFWRKGRVIYEEENEKRT